MDRIVVWIAAIAVIAGGVGSGQEPSAKPEPAQPKQEKPAGGWWDDVFSERSVTLGVVLASPEVWRDVPVSFVFQFRQPAKAGPSFFTKFEPDQWLNFVAWPDEAPLWEKKAFDSDFPHLFIRRDSPDAKVVGAAAIYDRFLASAVVRDVIKGKPWIEVTAVRKLPEKISEGSLVHLVKGLTLRDHRRFEAAAREFEAADGDTLPVSVRLVGMREHALALLNARDPKAAEERMLAALALDPANSETAVALAHVRERAKEMPERRAASRPVPPAAEPKIDDEEPVVPGPPDPLADRPRRKTPPRVAESRPASKGRQQNPR
jgi:hypothetical protein